MSSALSWLSLLGYKYQVCHTQLKKPLLSYSISDDYRDDMKTLDKQWGLAHDSGVPFDYDKAPDRGWQEGRKDFSHKVSPFLPLYLNLFLPDFSFCQFKILYFIGIYLILPPLGAVDGLSLYILV